MVCVSLSHNNDSCIFYFSFPFIYIEAGQVSHECESELVCRWTIDDKVPYFNAGIYLDNKRRIGKVDEILGKIHNIMFTIKMEPGVQSKSFQVNDLVFIGTDKVCKPRNGRRNIFLFVLVSFLFGRPLGGTVSLQSNPFSF